MEISSIIIICVGLIIVMAFMAMTLEFALPLKIYYDLIQIIRPYLYEFETTLVMNEENLIKQLSEHGLVGIKVKWSDDSFKFGQVIELSITGYIPSDRLLSSLIRKEEQLLFNYEKKIRIRQIQN